MARRAVLETFDTEALHLKGTKFATPRPDKIIHLYILNGQGHEIRWNADKIFHPWKEKKKKRVSKRGVERFHLGYQHVCSKCCLCTKSKQEEFGK